MKVCDNCNTIINPPKPSYATGVHLKWGKFLVTINDHSDPGLHLCPECLVMAARKGMPMDEEETAAWYKKNQVEYDD